MLNALTIDLEEYFHPTEVQLSVGFNHWSSYPSRIRLQTELTLEILAKHNVRATFFVLGWVAERYPELIQDIHRAGHEIGCHSYAHQLVYELTPAQFEEDLQMSVASIADACGVTPRLYRAPSYSITAKSLWALDILAANGFTHDSSIYPIRHDRYGIPDSSRYAYTVNTPSGPIQEIPAATVMLAGNTVAPVGGGAYLRLLPYRYMSAGIRLLNEKERHPACIYIHPWELDPKVPRLIKGALSSLRTYSGLRSMAGKLDRLLTDFRFAPLTTVYPGVSTVVVERRQHAIAGVGSHEGRY